MSLDGLRNHALAQAMRASPTTGVTSGLIYRNNQVSCGNVESTPARHRRREEGPGVRCACGRVAKIVNGVLLSCSKVTGPDPSSIL